MQNVNNSHSAARGEQTNWKTEKTRKENNRKNRTVKKKRLNRLNFWKNQPVRFGFSFISLKPKKTERNQKNRAKLVWTDFCPKNPNQTETAWFEPVSVVFLKNFGWVTFFLIKTEQKMITPIYSKWWEGGYCVYAQ
jgi:hypothetical protein